MSLLSFYEQDIKAIVGMLKQQGNQFPAGPDGYLSTLEITEQVLLASVASADHITPFEIKNFLLAQANFISRVEETTEEIKQRKRGALLALEDLSFAFVREPLSPPKTKEGSTSQTLMIEGPQLMLSGGVERG